MKPFPQRIISYAQLHKKKSVFFGVVAGLFQYYGFYSSFLKRYIIEIQENRTIKVQVEKVDIGWEKFETRFH